MKKTIIAFCVLIAIAALYLYLGGVSSTTIEIVAVDGYSIVGIDYKGRYKSSELEKTYFKVKEILGKEIEGAMVVVNYSLDGDSLENGFVKQFLGVSLMPMDQAIPNGFAKKYISTKRIIRAEISAHNLVMPSPKSIENDIRDFAASKNVELVNYTIEKYVSDRELIVEVPIVD